VAAADALWIMGTETIHRAHSRLIGIAENSNRLAYAVVFAAAVLWFLRTEGPPTRWRALMLPAVLVLVLTALLTASRNGLLQVLLFGAWVIKEHRALSGTRRVYALLVVGALAALLFVVVPSAQWLRATSFDTALSSPGGQSTKSRLTTVQIALELVREYPLFGIGPGNFESYHQARLGNELQTHNSYLWALTSGGPLLLLLYLLLFRRLYRRLAAFERSGPPRLGWLAKALRVNLVLFMAFSVFADFWLSIFVYVFVGMAIALSRLWDPRTSSAWALSAPARWPGALRTPLQPVRGPLRPVRGPLGCVHAPLGCVHAPLGTN
jgi:O-antigen ligase